MDVKKFVLSYYKNAADGFHIARFTAPKEALKPHNHEYFQIYYVVGGIITHHLDTGTATLSAGDIFILPPNKPHYIETEGKGVDFYSMSFMPDYFMSVKDGNKLILDFLSYLRTANEEKIEPKVTLYPADAVFLKALFERIMAEFTGDKAGKKEIIKEAVSVVLSLFARVYFENNATALASKENRRLVMHSIEYIKNHFDEELTLSDIAKRSAMSKTSFCTIFSSIVGESFKDYLNRVRIERAAELIKEGERITSAASLCGYGELSTFYRNFKKYMYVSPSEFAKKK